MAITLETAGPSKRKPAKKKTAKAKAAAKGRKYSPRTPQVAAIDPEDVVKLASYQCTNKDIAAFFNVTVAVLEYQFSEELARGRSQGRVALRQLQWQAARKGSPAMLIWLGKQDLGQTDEPQGGNDTGPDLTALLQTMVSATYGSTATRPTGETGEQPSPP